MHIRAKQRGDIIPITITTRTALVAVNAAGEAGLDDLG
jgi:hypothetical protein